MHSLRTITILLLTAGVGLLIGQRLEQEQWRNTLLMADRLRSEGRFDDAERALRSALATGRRLELGLTPLATIYNNLAGLYEDMGRCDAAAHAYQRSVALWESAGPLAETYLLRTANHLVGAYLECGAVKDAERHHRALVAPRIAMRVNRDRDPDVAHALTNLGSIKYHRRRYSESRAAFDEALAIQGRLSAEPSVQVAILLNNIAFSLLQAGETDQAVAQSRRAIGMVESTAGAKGSLLVSALVGGAKLCVMARRSPEAEALLHRAIAVARSTLGEEHPLTLTAMLDYVSLLKSTHRKKEAAALERQIRELRDKRLQRAQLQTVDRHTVDIRELSHFW